MAISLERCGAVILCGGQSRRMGTCKARLTVEGEPVLHRLAGALSFFEERLLSANDAALGAGLSWTVVEDRFPGLAGSGASRCAAGIKERGAAVRVLRSAGFFGAGSPVPAGAVPRRLRCHGVPGRYRAAPSPVRDLHQADAARAGAAP